MSLNVQGGERKKNISSFYHNVSANKRKTLNNPKTLYFFGGRSIIRGFLLSAGGLGT
jgi:hypothetical protein